MIFLICDNKLNYNYYLLQNNLKKINDVKNIKMSLRYGLAFK
jgi:hypothetical protein